MHVYACMYVCMYSNMYKMHISEFFVWKHILRFMWWINWFCLGWNTLCGSLEIHWGPPTHVDWMNDWMLQPCPIWINKNELKTRHCQKFPSWSWKPPFTYCPSAVLFRLAHGAFWFFFWVPGFMPALVMALPLPGLILPSMTPLLTPVPFIALPVSVVVVPAQRFRIGFRRTWRRWRRRWQWVTPGWRWSFLCFFGVVVPWLIRVCWLRFPSSPWLIPLLPFIKLFLYIHPLLLLILNPTHIVVWARSIILPERLAECFPQGFVLQCRFPDYMNSNMVVWKRVGIIWMMKILCNIKGQHLQKPNSQPPTVLGIIAGIQGTATSVLRQTKQTRNRWDMSEWVKGTQPWEIFSWCLTGCS